MFMSNNEMVRVDVRGVLCPIPVVETKKVVDAHPNEVIVTIVDNEVSRDNVCKFGESRGYTTTVTQQGKDFYIQLIPQGKTGDVSLTVVPDEMVLDSTKPMVGKTIVMTKDYLGEGSEELGRTLMKTFLFSLSEADHLPKKMLFINGGVKLVVEDSPHLDVFKALADKGVELAACGVCLDFYGIKDKLAVGSITNMYAIVESLTEEHVVTL